MFSIGEQRLVHLEAFGFVVLRRLPDDREVVALTAEVTSARLRLLGVLGAEEQG